MGECMNLMYLIATQPWFFGELTEQQSNELLAFQSLGTFLVRYSVAREGVFTISYVSPPQSKEDTEKYGADALLVYHERFEGIQAAGLINKVKEFTEKHKLRKLKGRFVPCKGRPDIFTRLTS